MAALPGRADAGSLEESPQDSPQAGGMRLTRSMQSLDCRPYTAAGEDPGGESVRVYVRVRPPTDREEQLPQHQRQQIVVVDQATSSVLLRGEPPRTFTFDGVAGEQASQEEVFELVGRGVGASCLAGYNGSVYVYGQTGAGKTYTMSGPMVSVQAMQFDERRGLMCRTLDLVFGEIHRRGAEAAGVSYVCRCSFLEIYKEQIMDLLDPSNTGLQIREDINRGVYVERLSEPAVSSLAEAFQVLWRGVQQRHVGATHMNERSSRSHAVFTLSVERAQTSVGVTSTRVARLSLVDLAGSERQQAAAFDGIAAAAGASAPAGNQTLRVKEAGAINKSLSALTNVIMSLSRAERTRRKSQVDASPHGGRRGFVHYRDSKLTFLLRDSLGGNSKTVIVANVSPLAHCQPETLSTLKFAARAKHIRCAAVRNEEYSGTVESLMLEVKSLRQQLSDLGGRSFNRSPSVPEGTTTCVDEEAEEATIREDPDDIPEADILYSRKRVRRLEVLLAAALERERRSDMSRDQLSRLARFLEALDGRRTAHARQLHADYAAHAARLQAAARPGNAEAEELLAKLLGFGRLLGNLVSSGAPAAPPQPPADANPQAADGLTTAAPYQAQPVPVGDRVNAVGDRGGVEEEKAFLREENRLLRAQLEGHPEVRRLAAENAALRAKLSLLDPCSGISHVAQGRAKQGSESSSEEEDSDVEARGPLQTAPRLAADMLTRSADAEDGTLRTWIYFQKMAKEVADLLRAKERLASVLKELRENEGGDAAERIGLGTRGEGGSKGSALQQSCVDPQIIDDLVQATAEAHNLAGSILGRHCSPRRLGAKEVDGEEQAGSRSPRGVPGAGREQDWAADAWVSLQGSRARSDRPGDRSAQLRQALQKIKHLHGTLDLLNSAYNEAYDQFQSLREEYESRVEESQFYEVQCHRLDLHCHELTEQLRNAPARGPHGAAAPGAGQKRSFSLSSLRDAGFWQSRFAELSQLTGIDEAETLHSPTKSRSLPAGACLQPAPAFVGGFLRAFATARPPSSQPGLQEVTTTVAAGSVPQAPGVVVARVSSAPALQTVPFPCTWALPTVPSAPVLPGVPAYHGQLVSSASAGEDLALGPRGLPAASHAAAALVPAAAAAAAASAVRCGGPHPTEGGAPLLLMARRPGDAAAAPPLSAVAYAHAGGNPLPGAAGMGVPTALAAVASTSSLRGLAAPGLGAAPGSYPVLARPSGSLTTAAGGHGLPLGGAAVVRATSLTTAPAAAARPLPAGRSAVAPTAQRPHSLQRPRYLGPPQPQPQSPTGVAPPPPNACGGYPAQGAPTKRWSGLP